MLLFVILSTAPASAQRSWDRWSEPNPGIRYLHRTTDAPCSIHALVADLSVDGVEVIATPHDQRWRSVSSFARDNRAAAAINGGFWGTFARAQGITAGGGRRWPSVEDDEEHGFFAVGRAGRAWISPPEELREEIPASSLAHAVSGRPMIVRAGAVDRTGLDETDYATRRHPRTAAGVSRDGRTVVLIVVDGRQQNSRGANLYELAELMVELGAHDAINLDGGGSSAMFVAGEGGMVNVPSGGRWEARLGLGVDEAPPRERQRTADDGLPEVYARGVEREVMNHLAILAPPPPGSELEPTDAFADMPRLERATAPRPPPLSLGTTRELLYPLAWSLALLTPLFAVGAILIRRRRRRRA